MFAKAIPSSLKLSKEDALKIRKDLHLNFAHVLVHFL